MDYVITTEWVLFGLVKKTPFNGDVLIYSKSSSGLYNCWYNIKTLLEEGIIIKQPK